VIFFVDASALVKLYHDEVGADVMRNLFRHPEYKGSFFISDVVALEVLVRLAKRGRVGGRKERRTFIRMMKMHGHHRVESLNVIALEAGVVRNAESLAVLHSDSGAGTLDLVHAASARQVQERLPDRPLTFVVADRKLRSLVERLGFRTFDPERGDPAQLAPDLGHLG
jgi:predicted nucleic acid-binding protein